MEKRGKKAVINLSITRNGLGRSRKGNRSAISIWNLFPEDTNKLKICEFFIFGEDSGPLLDIIVQKHVTEVERCTGHPEVYVMDLEPHICKNKSALCCQRLSPSVP